MTYALIFFVFALAVAHVACDVQGVPIGKQVRWLFKPAVWLVYGVTLGRVDLSKCRGCKEREERLDRLFGKDRS